MNEQDYDQGVHDQVKTQRHRDLGRVVRLIFAAAIVVGVVVMGLDNRGKVRVGYPGGHRDAALWLVLVGAAVAGVVIGWLIKHRPHHRL